MYFYGFYALKEKEYSNKVLIELSLKTAKAVKADERFGNVIPSASKSHDQDLRSYYLQALLHLWIHLSITQYLSCCHHSKLFQIYYG